MRHDGRLDPLHDARPLVAALGLDAVLDPASEQHLHADADAEHRARTREPAPDDPLAPDRAQACHARGVGPDTGHEQPVGGQGGLEVTGERHLRAGALDGAHGGAEVPDP